MGFVDRGGGREAKGSSLRRSKKNPGAAATRNKDSHKNYATATVRTVPTPPLAIQTAISAWVTQWLTTEAAAGTDHAEVVRGVTALARALTTDKAASAHCFVDTAIALLSRKLESDQEGILRRAFEDGHLSSMVCWCTEMERQTVLLETCRNHNQLALKDRTATSRGSRAAGAAAATPAAAPEPASKVKKGGAKKVRFAGEEDAAAATAEPKKPATSGDSLGLVKAGATPASTATAEGDNGSILYCIVGVHVNNIDRTNKKVQEQWLEDVSEKAKHPEVVGVLSGLNLSRDVGTHYAQEHLLKEMWRIAGEEKLPLVLHVYANDATATTQTADRLAEILQELYAQCREQEAAPVALVLYNGLRLLAHSKSLQQLVRVHRPSLREEFPTAAGAAAQALRANGPSLYAMVTADGLTASAQGNEEKSVIEPALVELLPSCADHDVEGKASPAVALSQLLLATGAPWATPQNMDDAYVCTMPNEPGNFLYVAKAVYEAMASHTAAAESTVDQETMMRVALLNTVRVFFADCVHQQLDKAVKAAARAEAKQVQDKKPEAHKSAEDEDGSEDGSEEGDEESRDSSDEEGEEEVGEAARAPRMHVPTGAVLVEAPPAPALPEDDSLEALLRQAAEERARLAREAEAEEEAALLRAGDDASKKKKEKKKNVKKNNRSNFSTFRNKVFAAPVSKKNQHDGSGDDENNNASDADNDNDNDKFHPRAAAESTAGAHNVPSSRSSSRESRDSAEAVVTQTTRPAAKKARRAAAGKASSHADPAAVTEATAAPSAKRGKPAKAARDKSDTEEEDDAEVEEAVTTMAPPKARKKKNKKFQKQMAQYQQDKDSDDSSDEEE